MIATSAAASNVTYDAGAPWGSHRGYSGGSRASLPAAPAPAERGGHRRRVPVRSLDSDGTSATRPRPAHEAAPTAPWAERLGDARVAMQENGQ